MYKEPWNSLLYLIALGLLITGACLSTDNTVIIMAVVFLAWDIGFVRRGKSFAGQDAKGMRDHARSAETLMSYFIGFYAVVFAVLFTEQAKRAAFLSACHDAHLRLLYIGAPLVLASIPMLFIPVQLEKAVNDTTPTRALKALMIVNVYCEKLVVFTFVHDLLRISRGLFSGA